MLDKILSQYPQRFRRSVVPKNVVDEAKRRVIDSIGCYHGAFNERPVKLLRETMTKGAGGTVPVWGTKLFAPPEIAAWVNGTGVRALDFNDTYLSKEPCHPSDMLSSFWAAAHLSGGKRPGAEVLRAMVLGYEVMCRLCDAASIRARGWDHVTYLPIATAVGCSYLLKLTSEQTRHAIALSMIGNTAMRQTRVGTISDWKAACASYAARSGLWAARLAKSGFSGPSNIFEGRHGFFNQVSGPFQLSEKPFGHPWMIMKTHTKFYPAEHHAQSAIEAAISARRQIGTRSIKKIIIETFRVAVEIIGSEKEKWQPTTRETADHSIPYLVAAAILDGDVTLKQFQRKRYLDPDVRALLAKTVVKESKNYSRIYPEFLPNHVIIELSDGTSGNREILLPKGYAGRAMTDDEIRSKFLKLAPQKAGLLKSLSKLETLSRLPVI